MKSRKIYTSHILKVSKPEGKQKELKAQLYLNLIIFKPISCDFVVWPTIF